MCYSTLPTLGDLEKMHLVFAANGMISIIILSWQLLAKKVMPAGEGALIWAMVFGACCFLSSLLPLLSKCVQESSYAKDRNFRRAVLLKGCLLCAKSTLLTFPEAQNTVDMRYIWSCVPDFCPSWCTERSGGGQCATSQDRCVCDSVRPQEIFLFLTITTSILMSLVTVVGFAKTIFRLRHERCCWCVRCLRIREISGLRIWS